MGVKATGCASGNKRGSEWAPIPFAQGGLKDELSKLESVKTPIAEDSSPTVVLVISTGEAESAASAF